MLKTALAVMLLAGITSSAQAKDKRLNATFQASEFNRAASSYYEKPTFLSLSKDGETLWVKADFIRPINETTKYSQIGFRKSNVEEYIGAVSKYLAWQEIAARDGDIIDKRIAKIKGAKKSGKLKFDIYSGNCSSHYLWVRATVIGVENAQMHFDLDDATAFRQTLIDWRDGNLEKSNVEDKYK